MSERNHQFWMGGVLATQLDEVSDDPAKVEDGNFWAVLIDFEGKKRFAKFAQVQEELFPSIAWSKLTGVWESSHSEDQYIAYVNQIRELIAEGGVYQVNACRELRTPYELDDGGLRGLFSQMLSENPAPHASYLSIPGIEIASASPELFLSRSGDRLLTSPIKGTLRAEGELFGEKDKAENLMIVDLMRNDLGQIADPGSVEVSELFRDEEHPGLRHLVSDICADVGEDISWAEIFIATTPPGSVSGAPKSAALKVISEHELARGPYCGALGWIHGDRAQLSVAIRTFWSNDDGLLRFGTGAGITWGSDPTLEWQETQLKAQRLISIAGGDFS